MKKLLYFTILTFMLIPFAVRAEEINLEEIHDSISKDNEITVKSIPLEQYKNTDYFKSCMGGFGYYSPTEKDCLEEIYSEIVVSKIKKSIEIPQNIDLLTSCDLEKNICEIKVAIGYDFQNSVDEEYKINLEEVEDVKKTAKMKSNYRLDDLGYINQTINYKNMQELYNAIKADLKPLYIYPDLKEELEKNKHFDFVITSAGIASGEFIRGAGTDLVAYYNDIAVDYVNLRYTTYTRLYVSDTTPKTRDEYAKAAEKRIKEYINDDSYEVKVVFNERYNPEYCEEFDDICIAKDVFEEGDEYRFEMYTLYLNGESFELEILAVPEKEIKKLKVKSTDYDNDISVETESADVPLDASVKAEDLTVKYKGFLKAYDIDLYSAINDEYITQVKDGIIVRIPLPDEYDKKKLEIYHIKEDGTKGEKYKAIVEEIDGKKYAIFTTNHFSIYAIQEVIEEEIKDTDKEEVKDDIKDSEKEEIKQELTENPNTYDGIGSSIILLVLSILGIIGIGLYLRKKERNEI